MTVLANNQERFIENCIYEGTDAFNAFCVNIKCGECNCDGCQIISWREPQGVSIQSGVFILLLKEAKI